jgi:hypothetical protein
MVECRAQSYTTEGREADRHLNTDGLLHISMEIWKTILLAVGGQAAMLAVLAYVGKSIFERLIARDTKRFENDLKAKSDAASDRLRYKLQLQTIEHQVLFSRLHEKRASVIAELNDHLVEALWEAEDLLSPTRWTGEPDKAEKYEQARIKLAELYRYFDKHRIYLPEEMCTSLQNLIQNVRSQVIEVGVRIKTEKHLFTREMMDTLDSSFEAFTKEAPVARKGLENEFRSLLGATTKALQPAPEDSRPENHSSPIEKKAGLITRLLRRIDRH